MNSHETLWRNYVTSSHKSIIFKANRGEKNKLPHWNDRLRAHLSAAAAEVRRQSSNISKRLVTNNCYSLTGSQSITELLGVLRHTKAMKFTY